MGTDIDIQMPVVEMSGLLQRIAWCDPPQQASEWICGTRRLVYTEASEQKGSLTDLYR
jgi:hypothetical protein